jgi:GR25 family glycosyltransferase involved in LPS biosynthesis
MNYTGFYINLDRSTQRKEEMVDQLEQLQLSSQYSRFPAADGNVLNCKESSLRKGEIGCFTSHYLLLENNLFHQQHLHIIEDDIILSRSTAPTLRMLLDSQSFNNFDIIFTDISLPFDPFAIRKYKTLLDNSVEKDESGRITSIKKYTVIDLRDNFFAGTCSFVIHKNAIAKLHDLLKQEIKIGPRDPIDLFIRAKVREGEIRAGCIFPFITSIRLEHATNTTISERYEDDVSVLAMLLMRHSFFIECDWPKCNKLILDYFTPLKQDMHQTLLSHVFGFVLSDRFKFF